MAKKTHISPEAIRRIRRELGETQSVFAARLSVDPVTVARWETGQRNCTGLHARTIAELDGIARTRPGKNTAYNVIALFNHKGGVSKTTTTYNLAWALANEGKRVLMIDGDPQCNLTGMTLSLAGEQDFEVLYRTNPEANLFGALRPAFESMPEAIDAVECFEVPGRMGLYLLPGHVSVAEYDVPLGVAHELTGSLGVMKNLPGALSRLIDACAAALDIEYVLLDMSPAISSLNQNMLMSSTHFIVPCSPDYFCAQAIDSLTKVIPRWMNWRKRALASGIFDGAAYPLPNWSPLFLGTINQRFRPRYGEPARAFKDWIDRINERVEQQLIPVLKSCSMTLPKADYERASVNSEPYNLANISDFNSLIARSQEHNVPIFELTDQQLAVQGKILENTQRSRDRFGRLFEQLACSVLDLTGGRKAKSPKKTKMKKKTSAPEKRVIKKAVPKQKAIKKATPKKKAIKKAAPKKKAIKKRR